MSFQSYQTEYGRSEERRGAVDDATLSLLLDSNLEIRHFTFEILTATKVHRGPPGMLLQPRLGKIIVHQVFKHFLSIAAKDI